MRKLLNDIKETIFSEEEIKSIVHKLGKQISIDYLNKNLLLVCILKGSTVFMADLMRQITIPCDIDFMCASSYGNNTQNLTGDVKISKNIQYNLNVFDVLLVEDILDTGNTLNAIKSVLDTRNPNSLKICTLFDKPSRRKVDITADYIGTTVPDEFIVGYGLDYAEKYRNLPFVGILKEEIYKS